MNVSSVKLIIALTVLMIAPSAAWAQEDQIVATIGDFVIRRSDINRRWETDDPGSFSEMHQKIYATEKRGLDAIIADHLLSAEAAKLGISVSELLQHEVSDKLPPISEEYARVFFEKSHPPNSTFESAKTAVSDFLKQEAFAVAEARYLRQLAESVMVKLQPFRHRISIDAHDREIGNASAPVQIVEFGDFECPFCREVEPVLKKIRDVYGESVRLVWKDFPLPSHANAKVAAAAALCANDQERFWSYHDVLLADRARLSVNELKGHAKQIGLDPLTFGECLDSGKHQTEITNAVSDAISRGVSATPAIFINGRPLIGAATFELLADIISKELGPAAAWRVGP